MAVAAAAVAIPLIGINAANLGIVGAAVVAGGIYAAAGYIDSRYIMPQLLGKGKAQAETPRLLGVPVGSNEPGAPRIWALGRRVRVPTHIMWQAEKVREQIATTHKDGTTIDQRKVLITAALSLNDRSTRQLERLVGNGVLILARDRNLIEVVSDKMTAAESGGVVTFTAGSTEDPDFLDRFQVGDYVECEAFVCSGANLNVGQLLVLSVVGHGAATPSYMTAKSVAGNSMSGLTATGGTSSAPAIVERVDDKVIQYLTGGAGDLVGIGVGSDQYGLVFHALTKNPAEVFTGGDVVSVAGLKYSTGAAFPNGSNTYTVYGMGTEVAGGSTYFLTLKGKAITAPYGGGVLVSISDADRARVYYAQPPKVAPNLFPTTFDPDQHYYSGSDTQDPDSLMEANIGVDNVSAYRGVAYQVLDQFVSSQFGDSLPFQLEGVISVDDGMTWQEALTLCAERGGVAREFVDTFGVTARPFEGFFMRGAVTGVTNLFPLLLAGQITSQERDGIICFQDTDAADVVQIENGAQFSHMGAFVGNKEGTGEKYQFAHGAREDLPTSIGIRHQDPDNAYADGYQHFGLRNPTGVDHENRQEIDLSNLVLTRKQARNLAATVMRRAWVNSTTVELTLTANYLDLLEGDLITFTDDEGNDHTARIILRDVGTNFLVKVTAAIEKLDLAVTGSPVQSAAGVPPTTLVVPPIVIPTILDIPPVIDSHAFTPGLYVAATATSGGTWSGVSVWLSRDSEATWSLQGILGGQGTCGTATTALPAASASETYGSTTLTYDLSGFVVVEFDTADAYGFQQLANIGVAVEGGTQWFCIQEPDGTYEIFGAASVLQTDARTFILGSLLRGLRGTWAAAQVPHTVGARVTLLEVLVDSGSMVFVPITGPLPTGNVSLRFVPTGQTIADVQSVSVVPTFRSVAPFDPRVLTKTIGGSPFDARFTTENWTRLNQTLGTLPPYPMDEGVEAYRFTIFDPTGSAIRRTKTITAAGTGSATLRDPWVTYTAAEQTADGYTPSGSTSFVVAVQQIGTYGESRLIKRTV